MSILQIFSLFFKCRLKNRPIGNRTHVHHLNTILVCYSHCLCNWSIFLQLDGPAILVVHRTSARAQIAFDARTPDSPEQSLTTKGMTVYLTEMPFHLTAGEEWAEAVDLDGHSVASIPDGHRNVTVKFSTRTSLKTLQSSLASSSRALSETKIPMR